MILNSKQEPNAQTSPKATSEISLTHLRRDVSMTLQGDDILQDDTIHAKVMSQNFLVNITMSFGLLSLDHHSVAIYVNVYTNKLLYIISQ